MTVEECKGQCKYDGGGCLLVIVILILLLGPCKSLSHIERSVDKLLETRSLEHEDFRTNRSAYR